MVMGVKNNAVPPRKNPSKLAWVQRSHIRTFKFQEVFTIIQVNADLHLTCMLKFKNYPIH